MENVSFCKRFSRLIRLLETFNAFLLDSYFDNAEKMLSILFENIIFDYLDGIQQSKANIVSNVTLLVYYDCDIYQNIKRKLQIKWFCVCSPI